MGVEMNQKTPGCLMDMDRKQKQPGSGMGMMGGMFGGWFGGYNMFQPPRVRQEVRVDSLLDNVVNFPTILTDFMPMHDPQVQKKALMHLQALNLLVNATA